MKKISITQEQMSAFIASCYTTAMKGVPGSKSCQQLADEYLIKYREPTLAAKALVNHQITNCAAVGFMSNLGGVITIPVGMPANIVSVLYMQMRMIGALAIIGGYNLADDEVKTVVLLCLIDASISDVFKKAGIKIGNKMAENAIKKIPGSILFKINKIVGMKLITKTGTGSAVRLTNMIPIAGGIVSAGIDYVATDKIAKRAYKTFILKKLD